MTRVESGLTGGGSEIWGRLFSDRLRISVFVFGTDRYEREVDWNEKNHIACSLLIPLFFGFLMYCNHRLFRKYWYRLRDSIKRFRAVSNHIAFNLFCMSDFVLFWFGRLEDVWFWFFFFLGDGSEVIFRTTPSAVLRKRFRQRGTLWFLGSSSNCIR